MGDIAKKEYYIYAFPPDSACCKSCKIAERICILFFRIYLEDMPSRCPYNFCEYLSLNAFFPFDLKTRCIWTMNLRLLCLSILYSSGIINFLALTNLPLYQNLVEPEVCLIPFMSWSILIPCLSNFLPDMIWIYWRTSTPYI